MTMSAEPLLILDGETRQQFPDVHSDDGDASEIDEDAAEDDDIFERSYMYPRGDSDHESGTDDTAMIAAADSEAVWRLSNEGDDVVFVMPEFDLEPGPKQGLKFALPSHARELEYFYKFIPPALITLAMRETNRYASYHQRKIAKRVNKRWRIVNFNDMQAFIGMLICMGVDRKSTVEDYWSSDIFLQNPGIASVMTHSRFQMIMCYFHLADAEDDPRRDPDVVRRRRRCEDDPLYKINPWMEPIVANCIENYQLGQEISIVEGMVGLKDRSKIKQLPHKPCRTGIKVWQLCDSITGYIGNFASYIGVKYKSLGVGQKREKGVVKKLTMELVAPFTGVNHIIFCDSRFTSVLTAMELMELGVFMIGSFNCRNRKSMPPQLIPEGKKKKLPLKVGDMRAASRTDTRINITAYQDTVEQVLILNTVYPPLETENVLEGCEGVERHVPVSLQHCRRYMGGVDRSIERNDYHTVRKSNRWWMYLACYLIDVTLVNAYICFKASNPDTTITHKGFHLCVGQQLIGGYTSRSQKLIREVESTITQALFIREENLAAHVVCKMSGRQKSCKQCSKEGKKTTRGRLSETSKGCVLCRVHLHAGECFAAFHHRMTLRGKRSASTQTGSPQPKRRLDQE